MADGSLVKVEDNGPRLEDVIKEVKIPEILPPTIPKRELIEEAMEQTATLRRVASAAERGVELSSSQTSRLHFYSEQAMHRIEDITFWVRVGVFLHAVSVVTFVIWLAGR